MNMLNEEDIIREAQRLEHLKDLLTALRRRGYDNVICADDAHDWELHHEDFVTNEPDLVRVMDYTCARCGMKRHEERVYGFHHSEVVLKDPFAELNRAQHRGEEE